MDVVLDGQTFISRSKQFLEAWNKAWNDETSPWFQVDAVVFLSGVQDEGRPIPKPDQLHLWLFGYVFPNTLIVVLRNGCTYIMSGPKKLGVLKQLENLGDQGSGGLQIVFMPKSNDAANQAQVQEIMAAIKASAFSEVGTDASRRVRLGECVGKSEEPIGPFTDAIQAWITDADAKQEFDRVSIGDAVAALLAIHDEKALGCVTKAAVLAVRLCQDVLVMRVEDVLDNETTELHTDIAEAAEKALDDPKKQERWKTKYQLSPDALDLVYVNVQSGGNCDLKASAVPLATPLNIGPGTILISLGTKYQDYTANVARTLLFNTTKDKRMTYQMTVEVLEYAVSLMVPGAHFKSIYDNIRDFVEKKNATLLPYLTRSLGHTLGLEYRDPSLILNGKSSALLSMVKEKVRLFGNFEDRRNASKKMEGMVMNVSIGFSNIPSKDEGHTTGCYSIWLADTVLVRSAKEGPQVLTSALDKRLRSVNYEVSEDAQASESTQREHSTTASMPFKEEKLPTAHQVAKKGATETHPKHQLRLQDPRGSSLRQRDGKDGSSTTSSAPTTPASTNTLEHLGTRDPGWKEHKDARHTTDSPASEMNGSVDLNTSARGSLSFGRSGPTESVILRDRLRSRAKAGNIEEFQKMQEYQSTLRRRKLEELRQRFQNGGGENFSTSKRSIKKMTTLAAYRDPTEYPKDLKANRIYLDLSKEAVLIPVPCSGHVPFHVSTIRNVFCQAEGKKFYTMRLQFQVPGSVGFGYKADENPFPELTGPDAMFVKELIFRSSNPGLPQLCKSLKELQKRIKQREETGAASQEMAVLQPLELNRKSGKRILLKGLMMKSGTNNRRVPGILEAHNNGLRFSGSRVEELDINYANIKHAIFQPCENELVVLIHFHLKNPVFINKKKTSDVQFYMEIGAQTDDLDQRRGRSSYDPDEIAEEQRERELKRRLNAEFKRFVEALEDLTRANGDRLEFEMPCRELGFHGVPKNSSQIMLPTARCLVQLLEWPVFVLTLSEVEIVSFERVYHGLRQFDMVFVFKDYSRPVRQITTVPTKCLDMIKKWLNDVDIVWYESKGNLNWGEILKTIREDVVGFVEDGGFGIFLGDEKPRTKRRGAGGDSGDSEGDEDDDAETGSSDSSYLDEDDTTATEIDSEDASESDDDSDASESYASERTSSDEADSQEDSEDEDEEEEEGLTWEELERQAIQEDRKRVRPRDEDESGAKRTKRKKN